MLRNILKSDALRRFGGEALGLYIRLVYATSRWTRVRKDVMDRLIDAGEPFILVFWHNRSLMSPAAWDPRGGRVFLLISAHRDGEYSRRGVAPFGIEAIRGSASNPNKAAKEKGGAQALREMLKALKAGHKVVVTPDGPRGPRMRCNEGVVQLARLSGAPIVPFAYSTTRAKTLSTWDRFLVALPFSKGFFVWGEPVRAPRAAGPETVERLRRTLEERLSDITAEADRLAGRAPIEPAPPVPAAHVPAAAPAPARPAPAS